MGFDRLSPNGVNISPRRITNAINTTKMMPIVPLEVVVYGPAIPSLKMATPLGEKIDAA